MSLRPNYIPCHYADYSVKWCSGIPCNLYASLDIGLMLALMDGPMSANRRAVG